MVHVRLERNAGRSQMAQALFERDAPPDIRAEPAGGSRGPGAQRSQV